jgi:hypothetical protein
VIKKKIKCRQSSKLFIYQPGSLQDIVTLSVWIADLGSGDTRARSRRRLPSLFSRAC